MLYKKEVSARELTRAYLNRIQTHNPRLNAYLTVTEEAAYAAADAADKRIATGETTPLLGIPVGLKDMYMTAGVRTTAASRVLADYTAQYDATVVTRLKDAGAVILGKLNCDAWAHGSSGENSDFGPTKNPWNTELIPGGSSSGSAVAIGADLALAAGGTDTGGSIRLPAGYTNTVGLKPTYGRVSRYGIIAMASSLDSIGHFTKTVTDNALYLQVTAGKDPADATTSPADVPDYLALIGQPITGMKIGVPKEYFSGGLDPRIETVVRDALKTYERLGAELVEISLPYTEYAIACYYILQPAEVSSNLARYTGIRYGNDRALFGDEAKRRIMIGTYVLSSGYYDAYYKKATRLRTKVIEDFTKAFAQVDVILTPTSPKMPWKIGEGMDDPLAVYLSDVFTVTANIAGIPGLALPAGFVDGLPVGMQLLGPQLSEQKLYQVGYAFEEATQFWRQKPSI
jgi:aspartyl-tRNA(Asn)/glutamyl-tRNA(Gln) amidotransferase subunit A